MLSGVLSCACNCNVLSHVQGVMLGVIFHCSSAEEVEVVKGVS